MVGVDSSQKRSRSLVESKKIEMEKSTKIKINEPFIEAGLESGETKQLGHVSAKEWANNCMKRHILLEYAKETVVIIEMIKAIHFYREKYLKLSKIQTQWGETKFDSCSTQPIRTSSRGTSSDLESRKQKILLSSTRIQT